MLQAIEVTFNNNCTKAYWIDKNIDGYVCKTQFFWNSGKVNSVNCHNTYHNLSKAITSLNQMINADIKQYGVEKIEVY